MTVASVDRKSQFKNRVYEWAGKLDIEVRACTIRAMSNKWASCSTSGYLTFSKELLEFESDLADYVIVHELLHFRAPNDGILWKSFMMAHLGDYEALEKRLRSTLG